MAKDARELREEAAEATAAGKYKRALAAYLELERLEPRDAQWAKRAGETYRRLGNLKHAIEAFNRSAERYAQNGFLVQAIAVCKIVLQIDPQHVDTLRRLAMMNEQIGQTPTRAGGMAENNPALHDSPTVAMIRQPGALPLEPRPRRVSDQVGLRKKPGSTPQIALPRTKSKPIAVIRGAALDSVSLKEKFPDSHPRDESSPGIHIIPIDDPIEDPIEDPIDELDASALETLAADDDDSIDSMGETILHSRGTARGLSETAIAIPPPRRGLSETAIAIPIPPSDLSETAIAIGDTVVRSQLEVEDATEEHDLNLPRSGTRTRTVRDLRPVEEDNERGLMIEIEPPDATPDRSPEDLDPAGLELADAEEIPLPAPRAIGTAAQQALAATPLFAGLPSEVLEALVEQLTLVSLEPGQPLFADGDPNDSLYVIVEGEIAVAAKDAPGAEPARLGPGAFIGEVALLTDQPHTAVVTAVTAAELLRIDRGTLADVLGEHGDLLRVVLRFVRERLVDRWMRTTPLFGSVSDAERAELAGRFALLEVESGTQLLGAGMRPDGLYIVLAGEFIVHRGSRIIARLGPGSLIGETALLAGGAFKSDVLANGKALTLCMPARTFREVIMTHPHVLEYIGEQAEHSRRLQIL